MRLGIVSDEVHPDLAYAAKWAAERGITRMELRALWGQRVPDLTFTQLQETKLILDDYGICVSGLSPGIFKCSLYEHEFIHQQDRLKRTIDMAGELGTRKIICFGVRKDPDDPQDAALRVTELLQSFSCEASSQGCLLCFENEPGYYNGTPDEILRLQEAVYAQGGRLNWDMGNLFMAGYREYKNFYERLKPYIASIHMKDYLPDGICVPLGEGCLAWDRQIRDFITDDLTFMGEAMDMNLETHCKPLEECARRSFEFAAACIDRITGK